MVAVGLFQGSQFFRVTNAARDDAVHQSGAERVGVVHPVDESSVQVPVLGVVVAALLQLFAVVVDQLAGEDDQALVGSAVVCLVALIQHAGQLCGEAVGGHLIELAVALGVSDAGLGGVGDDDLQILGASQLQHLSPLAILIRADTVGHAGDHALGVHFLAFLTAAQVQGVQALLLVDPVSHLGEVGNGLHQLDLAVEAGFLVGDINKVIHERAEEVALTELHHLDRGILEDVAVVTSLCQNLVIQSFHFAVLLFMLLCSKPEPPRCGPRLPLFYAVVYK